jgi:predicted DNA-binding ribbon-helix-helix protein
MYSEQSRLQTRYLSPVSSNLGSPIPPIRSSLIIRNVVVGGRRTSIRLEPEMWGSLQEICKRENCTVHDIATMVAAEKGIGSLTAAMRVFVMKYFFEAATEDGHNHAQHGSGAVLQPLYQHLSMQENRTRL